MEKSFVFYNSYVNVNSIKVEKLPKTIDENGYANIDLGTFQQVTDENVREDTSINTILFTTFSVTNEKSVEAIYFPPTEQLNNAIVSIYRKTPAQNYYDFICELNDGSYRIYDYNIRNNGYYHYLVSALIDKGDSEAFQRYKYYIYDNRDDNGNEIYIRPKFDFWTICNVEPTDDESVYQVTGNMWKLGLNMQGQDITQNYSVTTWDTLGKYARGSQGVRNYASSSFSGLLGNFEEYKKYDIPELGSSQDISYKNVFEYTEKMDFNKNAYALETEKLDAWNEFCSDGELKLLRDLKGNAWIVQIADAYSYSIDNTSNLKQTTITFSWKEAEDINKFSIIGM